MTPDQKKEIVDLLDMIREDCEQDVKYFEGKPFTGKTVGEMHGILEAKISALAGIIKKIVEESK